MSRALGLLLWLQLGGWLRYLVRRASTPRGALLLLVGVVVVGSWLAAVFASNGLGGGVDREAVARYGPVALLLYCVVNVAFSPADRAVYFSPAEVQFLFPGPFSRRQLLAYKLLLTLLVSVPATLLLAVLVRVRHGWAPAVLIGLLLTSIFLQLFGVALGLIASTVGERLAGRGRLIVRIVAATAVAALLLRAGVSPPGLGEVFDQALNSDAWALLSWPLRSFFDTMKAQPPWDNLLRPAAVAVAVNLALAGLIFALDAHYLEASASASARLYARLQRLRGKSVGTETDNPAARPPRFEVPSLPHLGGIGPIAWRQLTAATRGLRRLLVVLVVLALVLVFGGFGPEMDRGADGLTLLLILTAWVSIFLTTLVPYDFRGDIDRIAALRALPIAPWRIAVGQLLTPVVVLTLVEWLLLAGVALSWPERLAALLACAAFVPPANFLLLGLDNLLFLLFPVRLMAATPGDFQTLGRNVLLSLGKLIGLSVVAGPAAAAAVVVYGLTKNVWLAAAAAWPVVLLAGLALVPPIAWAFRHFDVGRDVPA